MWQTFLATLTPMLTLFACIAIGYLLKKLNVLNEQASSLLAKIQVWVFFPATCFTTMAKYFTVSTLSMCFINILFATICVLICICLSIVISKLFVRQDCYERCIYKYSLAFANNGYAGDPIVLALFGEIGLFLYKATTLPISIAVYSWGTTNLTPKEKRTGGVLKSLINPPLIALFIGIVVGLTGLGNIIYTANGCQFLVNTLNMFRDCMGVNAMIITGIVIGSYNLPSLLKNKKVYFATFLRLIGLPVVILAIIYGIKELVNFVFGLSIDNNIIFLLFFATATPLGLNTIVFPKMYNLDALTGASMATISHTLFVITIPLLYALLTIILGTVPDFSVIGGLV